MTNQPKIPNLLVEIFTRFKITAQAMFSLDNIWVTFNNGQENDHGLLIMRPNGTVALSFGFINSGFANNNGNDTPNYCNIPTLKDAADILEKFFKDTGAQKLRSLFFRNIINQDLEESFENAKKIHEKELEESSAKNPNTYRPISVQEQEPDPYRDILIN